MFPSVSIFCARIQTNSVVKLKLLDTLAYVQNRIAKLNRERSLMCDTEGHLGSRDPKLVGRRLLGLDHHSSGCAGPFRSEHLHDAWAYHPSD